MLLPRINVVSPLVDHRRLSRTRTLPVIILPVRLLVVIAPLVIVAGPLDVVDLVDVMNLLRRRLPAIVTTGDLGIKNRGMIVETVVIVGTVL